MDARLEKFRNLRDRLAEKPGDDVLLYACSDAGKDVALEETMALFAARLSAPPATPGIRLNELHLYAYLRERAGRRAQGLSITNAAGLADLDFRFARDELAAVVREASAFLAKYPDSQGAAVILAEALTSFGSLVKAEKVFASLREQTAGDVAAVTNLAPDFHAGLGAALDRALPKLSGVSIVREIDASAARIVLTSADYLYFQKFGWEFVDSFSSHGNSGAWLSLHIMDMTPAETEIIMCRLEGIAGLRWGLSTEWTGLRVGDRKAKGYYHAVRFVRFWQVLLRNPAAAVFMIDTDTIFNGDVSGLFDLLNESDLALLLSPGRLEARNKVMATCTGAANTGAARAYLRNVAGYLAAYWERGQLPWGIDQVAMYAVLALTQAPLRIASIPGRVFDGSKDPNKLLWAAKA
jgi:hypothetical protein